MTYSFVPITDLKLVIVDHSASYRQVIIDALAEYKKRWGYSIASNVLVSTTADDLPLGIPIIITNYYYDTVGLTMANVVTVDSMQFLNRNHLRQAIVTTSYKYITDVDEAISELNKLGPVFAYDCETAKADDVEQNKKLKLALDPFKNQLTMFSFADNETTSLVISNESQEMEDAVMDFLTSTNSTVVIHNSAFDMKIVKQRTGKFIKNFDDTMLMYRIVHNYAGDNNQQKVGLKALAGDVYGKWAVSKDLFGIEHKYNEELIEYAGIDACATIYIYNELLTSKVFTKSGISGGQYIDNSFLPVELPAKYHHSKEFFYREVVKPQVYATIDLMLEGITVDFTAVKNLEKEIDIILNKISTTLENNPLIIDNQKRELAKAKSNYITDRKQKMRTINDYIKPYDHSDMTHRSYFIEHLRSLYNFEYESPDLLPNGHPKWAVKTIKVLQVYLPKDSPVHTHIEYPLADQELLNEVMIKLATDKAEKYNESYLQEIADIDNKELIEPFNVGSSKQKIDLFNFLKVPPVAISKKTGQPSWKREAIEEVFKTTTDPHIKEITAQFIDYSFGSIIKTTFLPSFENYVVKGKLRGDYVIGGAKSWRYTSQNP